MAKEYEKYTVGDQINIKLQMKNKDFVQTTSGLMLASLKQEATAATGGNMMSQFNDQSI